MVLKNENFYKEKKIVVTFDICSSTLIIEDLLKTDNLEKWKEFLFWINKYLKGATKDYNFLIYKFTGDGWLLLFEDNIVGESLIKFLKEFCNLFQMRYKKMIKEYLESPPQISGLTFGIDMGSLIKLEINGYDEYLGRAINVACRLQGAIKDRDSNPSYKALVSNHLYRHLNLRSENAKFVHTSRKLRNISGGKDLKCVKVILIE